MGNTSTGWRAAGAGWVHTLGSQSDETQKYALLMVEMASVAGGWARLAVAGTRTLEGQSSLHRTSTQDSSYRGRIGALSWRRGLSQCRKVSGGWESCTWARTVRRPWILGCEMLWVCAVSSEGQMRRRGRTASPNAWMTDRHRRRAVAEEAARALGRYLSRLPPHGSVGRRQHRSQPLEDF